VPRLPVRDLTRSTAVARRLAFTAAVHLAGVTQLRLLAMRALVRLRGPQVEAGTLSLLRLVNASHDPLHLPLCLLVACGVVADLQRRHVRNNGRATRWWVRVEGWRVDHSGCTLAAHRA